MLECEVLKLNTMIKALRLGNMAAKIIDMQSGLLKVHSIFSHAINFICEDDYLITILEDWHGCSSQVITINPSNLTNLISSLKITKDIINVRNIIDFEKAETIYFNLPEQINYMHYDSIKKNVMRCSRHIKITGNLSGFSSSILGRETIYSKYIKDGIQSLESAYLNNDKNRMAAAIDSFVGLGPGLTPSGDDFICGLFSVLFYCSGFMGIQVNEIRDMGLKIVEHAKDKTTIVGYNMLRSYLNGELPEHMHDFMNNILTREDESLVKLFDKILQIGSTSGSDMAAGILYAFYLIEKGWGMKSLAGGIND